MEIRDLGRILVHDRRKELLRELRRSRALAILVSAHPCSNVTLLATRISREMCVEQVSFQISGIDFLLPLTATLEDVAKSVRELFPFKWHPSYSIQVFSVFFLCKSISTQQYY